MDYGYMPFKYSLFYGKSVQNGINDTRLFGWREGISDPCGPSCGRITMKKLRSHPVEVFLITSHILLVVISR